MIKSKWIPSWAKYYRIQRVSQTTGIMIHFYDDSKIYSGLGLSTISELAKELAIEDIKQQIRDKPLADRVDMVNSPPHYTYGGIECIDGIEAALSEEEFRGYCKGNALKYTWRNGKKGCKIQDAEKAVWYLNRFIKALVK